MDCVSSLSSESVGQTVVLTQPAAKSLQPGQTVTINCKASPKVAHHSGSQYHGSWYQQKPGETPKLLIYRTSDRQSGISSRFSGSGAGNGIDFTLTISGVQAEDAAVYYCRMKNGRTKTSLSQTEQKLN
uniref:Ig-like domain-containing protein n=1 Tax=Mastacembelus armatus TaxID=205130 RepID=A0A3Q3MWP5_9TELE